MAERRVSEPSSFARMNPGEYNGGDRVGFSSGSMMKGPDPVSADEPTIDERWLVDPKLLYLGPKIGEGGHAKVYEGMYKASSVAVKIIQPASTTEDYAKRREKFLREIMMLSRVQHENLVKILNRLHLLSDVTIKKHPLLWLKIRRCLFGHEIKEH